MVLLATACVTVFDSNNHPVQVKLILDNGSQNSFVTERLVNKLGLSLHNTNTQISGIGLSVNSSYKKATIILHSKV